MKARVKNTGEIVTLRDLYSDFTARDVHGRYYHQGEISELIEESEHSIDWEQRRYEIAKEVIAAYVSNGDYPFNNEDDKLAKWCLMAADALIEELKKS